MTARPTLSADSLAAREALVVLGRRYHAAGWLFGTSGNLSARVTPDRIVVTASGRDKGALTATDFVEVTLDGALYAAAPGDRPSAETSLHTALYGQQPTTAAVLHVHTVSSALIQGAPQPDGPAAITLTGIEMIKGWDIWEPDAVCSLPVFDNHVHVPDIARDVASYYAAPRRVPAFLIAGHGITAWGATLFEASRHVEVTEFLCQIHRAQRFPGGAAT